MPEPYQLLVFDWDGTLVDSTGHIVTAATMAIESLGLPARAPSMIRETIGLGLIEAWQKLYPDFGEAECRGFAAAYRHCVPEAMLAPPALFEDVLATLETLRAAGQMLAVATGKSRAGLDRELEALGLRSLFAATRTADETVSKPDPAMLLEIMAELAAGPAATLVIGDTEYDLDMAANAGVAAVGVTSGAHARSRLVARRPVACLAGVAQLPAWLREQAGAI